MIWYDIYIHGFFLLLESPRGFTEEENEENITGTSEWWNWFGRTPNYRDSRINHMFRNTFPMRDN